MSIKSLMPTLMKVIYYVIAIYVFLQLLKILILSSKEGFELWKEIPRTPFLETETPTGHSDTTVLSPGSSSASYLALSLPPMGTEQARARFGGITSQICLGQDASEALKPVHNYLQRTNNYKRDHPDSCSAPNHELIGTFYLPADAVQTTPPTGLAYPPSTQCA